MIYFTFGEILRAAFAFFLLGAIFSAFSFFVGILLPFFGYIIKCICYSFKNEGITRSTVGYFNPKRDTKAVNKNGGFVSDFLFTLIFGLCFIAFSYALLDGYIRIFCLIISLVAYFFVGNAVEKIYSVVFFYLGGLVYYIFRFSAFLLTPTRYLLKFVLSSLFWLIRLIFLPFISLKNCILSLRHLDKSQ